MGNSEHWKEVLEQLGVRILKEKPIPYGVQWMVTDGKDRVPMNIYESGKVVIQGKDCPLKKLLERMKDGLNNEPKGMNRTAKYIVPFEDDLYSVLSSLEDIGVQITLEEAESCRTLRLRKQNKKLTLNHYKNGTLVVQGLSSDLFELMLEILDKQYGSSLELDELAARYVPDELREEVLIAVKERGTSEVQTGYRPEVVAFLPQKERDLLYTVYILLEKVESGMKLPDYTILVMPMVRVMEAFVKRLAYRLGLISEADIGEKKVGDLLRPQLGDPQNPKRFVDLIPKDRLSIDSYVVIQLNSAWTGTRHRVMHCGEHSLYLTTLEDAKGELYNIRKAIHEAYEYFIDKQEFLPNEVLPVSLEPNAELSKPQTSDAELSKSQASDKGEARIGIDESGKGDYFGPLVVAAVFVRPEDESWLRELGVRDSKKLGDEKVAEIAKELFKKLRGNYEIVVVPPSKYNDLYEKIKNLNNLLAWGHARALETLLERVDAKRAISDQFAAPEVLQNALMKQGKTIELIQRPKGEQDLAVATASILARHIFVSHLRKMKKHFKVDFPKGSGSDVEKAARSFVENHGREALSEVAKLHFKITERI